MDEAKVLVVFLKGKLYKSKHNISVSKHACLNFNIR